jgi:hypothetical protein
MRIPSNEEAKLSELLNGFEAAKSIKSKSELLSKAKYHILNEMSSQDIENYFVLNKSNFECLFQIDVWTSDLDRTNGVTEFIEPYEILEHILNHFSSLDDILNKFDAQIEFLINQKRDEKAKQIFVKTISKLTSNLGINFYF